MGAGLLVALPARFALNALLAEIRTHMWILVNAGFNWTKPFGLFFPQDIASLQIWLRIVIWPQIIQPPTAYRGCRKVARCCLCMGLNVHPGVRSQSQPIHFVGVLAFVPHESLVVLWCSRV